LSIFDTSYYVFLFVTCDEAGVILYPSLKSQRSLNFLFDYLWDFEKWEVKVDLHVNLLFVGGDEVVEV
jgi:hypothetical protein